MTVRDAGLGNALRNAGFGSPRTAPVTVQPKVSTTVTSNPPRRSNTSTGRLKKNLPPKSVGCGRYLLERWLGGGCFGEVWRGRDQQTEEEVAIKLESSNSRHLCLEHEVHILSLLAKPTLPEGFARCYFNGSEGPYLCMVTNLLGQSLEGQMRECGGIFSVTTTVLIAEQALRRIEYLHSKSFIHRDIKPENFLCGIGDKAHHLYLIDFGLSKKYFSGAHIKQRASINFAGTAAFVSLNTHRGLEQTRRDDLEALGHMLIYFLRGNLPWSGLQAINQEEKYKRIKKTKELVSVDDLCAGFPDAFRTFLQAARGLKFKERPNYCQLRKLFSDLREEEEPPLQDCDLEWLRGSEMTLMPLQPTPLLQQPDDSRFARGCNLWRRCTRRAAENP